MLEAVMCILNSFSTKSTISSWYRLGFFSKYLHKASNIRGVMLQGRPTLFERALVELKQRRLDFIAKTERSLQPITSAISAAGRLLRIISRICACCDSARFGAILRSDITFERDTFVDAAIVERTSVMCLRPERIVGGSPRTVSSRLAWWQRFLPILQTRNHLSSLSLKHCGGAVTRFTQLIYSPS
jgi:hypothetical protein